MRILVVHEVNYLSKIIYEFQILPEILSMLGHSVTVVDYNDSWRSESNGRRLWSKGQIHSAIHRAYPDGKIILHRPAMIRFPGMSRISGAIASGIEVVRLLKRSSTDVILLYGLPTVGIQTLMAARAYKVPIAFRAIDVTHELVPYRALVPPTRMLEKLVFNNVDLNIALTPLLRNYIEAHGVPEIKTRLLPSGVDATLFSPGSKNSELLARWGIGVDEPVILFMGTVYRFSGLERVIRDWRVVLAQHAGAKLLIVGNGEDQNRLTALAAESGVASNVIFTGMQPYSLLPDFIRSSDICINPFELNRITERILPTKLFQYLACGKPVVATRLPGTLPFLRGEEDGVLYAEQEAIAEVIGRLIPDVARRLSLGQKGVEAARKYDWTQIANQMASWLAELVR